MGIPARLSTVRGFALAAIAAFALAIVVEGVGYSQAQLAGDYAMLFADVLALILAGLIGRFHTRERALLALFAAVGFVTIFLGLNEWFVFFFRLEVMKEPDDGMWGLRGQAIALETFITQVIAGVFGAIAAFLRKYEERP